MKTIRWGVLGPGKIANKFADAVSRVEGCRIQAVASRTIERARVFATKYEVPAAYDDYKQLVTDPNVDAIYIATPHGFHKTHAILCLQNSKAVLCEKPMSVDLASTKLIVAAARKNKTFLMEAMWTRFMPVVLKAHELVKSKAIGEVRYLRADFGVKFPFDSSSRIFDLKLGGGSMLDIGVYPLFLALYFFGKPDEVKSFGHLTKTGSDELMNAMLYYKDGRIANILSCTHSKTPQTAEIVGTNGIISFGPAWWKTQSLTITRDDSQEVIQAPYDGNGYEFEIEEVVRCLRANKVESEALPLDFSLMMSEVSDTICHQIGVVYPS